ncbi:MAG: hypothetical protein LUB58_01630 [Oscillospiraceae bacterium]|nr:hypothetical protein [Oscillospiraceae bacterium]MCD8255630.1 hypothetical protein [Oscillospiraceae bacterium]
MKKPRNDEQANPMPEKIRTGLCAAVPLLLAVCLAAAAVYRLVNTGAVGWEALGLAAMGAVSVIRNQGKKRDAPPKDFMGDPLPVGDDAADRKKRRRAYLLDSLIVALVFAGLDILFIGSGWDAARAAFTQRVFPSLGAAGVTILTAVRTWLELLLIFYICNHLSGERAVRKYKRTERETPQA